MSHNEEQQLEAYRLALSIHVLSLYGKGRFYSLSKVGIQLWIGNLAAYYQMVFGVSLRQA